MIDLQIMPKILYRRIVNILSLIAFWFLIDCLSVSAEAGSGNSANIYYSEASQPEPKLFDEDIPLNLIIEFDFSTVLNDRSDDPDYTGGSLTIVDDDKNKTLFNIKIRARGNSRRLYGICSFPPLKIDFKKSETVNTIFDGQNKLKLVTHCSNLSDYEDYMLEEYLIYKTYNLLTDNSFRVRLVKITYKDLKHQFPAENHYAFLLEDDDDMAARNNSHITDVKILHPDSCNQNAVDLVTLFQYMIGNTDWWITTRHNVVIMQPNNQQLPIPIPYDFDYSGCIDAIYAKPSPQLNINSVTEHYFRGYCRTPEDYKNIIEQFNSKKNEIFGLYENFDYLGKRKINKMLKFFNAFYDIINNPDALKNEIDKTCITTPSDSNVDNPSDDSR